MLTRYYEAKHAFNCSEILEIENEEIKSNFISEINCRLNKVQKGINEYENRTEELIQKK